MQAICNSCLPGEALENSEVDNVTVASDVSTENVQPDKRKGCLRGRDVD